MYTINTYDLNGKHTILNEENKPLTFLTEEEAKNFLRSHGCSEEYIEDLSIEEVEDESELSEVFVSSQPL